MATTESMTLALFIILLMQMPSSPGFSARAAIASKSNDPMDKLSDKMKQNNVRTEPVSDGFELFFTSSKEEFQDYPITFYRPIPDWLCGIYIKNGLGQFEMGPRSFSHIFDAYGKLHSWKFHSNSTVSFTAKFIRTHTYRDSLELNNVAPYLLFQNTKPPFSKLESVEGLLRGIDNTNVNIYHFGNTTVEEMDGNPEMAALSDFWQSYQFDISTLNTKAHVNTPVPGGGILEASGLPLQSSSHPMRELGTGDLITFVSTFNPIPFLPSTMRLVRIKSLTVRELIAEISVKEVPYMHSFGMSENYAILFGQPMYTNLRKMLMTAEPVESLEWRPSEATTLYVVNLKSGSVKQLYVDPSFMMHHINSYEIPRFNRIIIDAITYPDIDFIKSLQVEALVDPVKRQTVVANPSLKRFVLDLKKSRVTVKHFPLTSGVEGAGLLDLPVINEKYRYRKYCFVYGVVLKADNVNINNVTLTKRNLCHGGKDKMWIKEFHYPTEPWFIARPDAKREDDGILLSIVLDGRRRRSYLAMFDARTMRLINKGYVPTTIPFSLHGRFFPW